MTFEQVFGAPPEVRASAPGRVNLIGEHTDYNGGYVLPTAIPQRTTVELRPKPRREIRALSLDVGEPAIFEYLVGEESRRGRWTDYLQGITWALLEAGLAIGGADILITSQVPLGSGLSSSAALEIALLRAFGEAYSLGMADVPMARLGQRAENGFVGAPVGIMDQMASRLAATGRRSSSTRVLSSGASSRCPRRPTWSSSTPASRTNTRRGTTGCGGPSARRRQGDSVSRSCATWRRRTSRASWRCPSRSGAAPGTS